MNSFKAVQRAIQFEIERQSKLLEKGERVVQETRLWNDATQTTHPMRSKEDAHDYRYFPEPDLVPLLIDKSWKAAIEKTLPELPEARRLRYTNEHGLSADDAYVLAENKEMSDFFDSSLKLGAPAKAAANLLIGPTMAFLNDNQLDFSQIKLTPDNMRDLIRSIDQGNLNSTTAKQVLLDLLKEPGSVAKVIEQKGLQQVSDEKALETVISKVLADNPAQLAEYHSGKTKVRQFFFGETMKALKGKGNPAVINKLLDEKLASD